MLEVTSLDTVLKILSYEYYLWGKTLTKIKTSFICFIKCYKLNAEVFAPTAVFIIILFRYLYFEFILLKTAHKFTSQYEAAYYYIYVNLSWKGSKTSANVMHFLTASIPSCCSTWFLILVWNSYNPPPPQRCMIIFDWQISSYNPLIIFIIQSLQHFNIVFFTDFQKPDNFAIHYVKICENFILSFRLCQAVQSADIKKYTNIATLFWTRCHVAQSGLLKGL